MAGRDDARRPRTQSQMKRVLASSAVLLMLALVALAGWLLMRPRVDPPPRADPPARTPSPATPESARPAKPIEKKEPCTGTARKPFAPDRITVTGVADDVPVIAPPRDANDVPGIPPLTTAGAHMFAWDPEQGISPGDRRGHVLLNAHTWPDGSALGNQLLAGLEKGDQLVVEGGSQRLCYRVKERIVVRAADGYPRYYDTKGPHRLAIIVCSGRRLGPGNWENRTIWFAAPRA